MGYKVNYSVYKITNVVTNQCYIGIDTYFPKRLRQHKTNLLNNKHRNKHLQYSFNKYKSTSFTFELLISCINREDMIQKEKECILQFDSLNNGFNHTIGGEGSFGYKHSVESKIKMASWKRIITKEWRQNISKGLTNMKKNNSKRKVDRREAAIIKAIYIKGQRPFTSDIAKYFNVKSCQISSICNNLSWKDNTYVLTNKDIELVQNIQNQFKNKTNKRNRIKVYATNLTTNEVLVYETKKSCSEQLNFKYCMFHNRLKHNKNNHFIVNNYKICLSLS